MPLGDRTGPVGRGPRTGRGRGFCSGFNQPGYMGPGAGRGGGRGFGGGLGRCPGWGIRAGFGREFYGEPYFKPVQPTKEEELQMLEQESKAIEQEQKILNTELTELKKRIQELKTKK